jgi:hypothetical protein
MWTPSGNAPWQRVPRCYTRSGICYGGDQHGQITNPFGHRWRLAQHVRDVSPEEIARAAAEAFGG